ncbi:MAG: carboxypeptidase-like regulatory domain-containing protein, partial [Tannerellaceae bacterium]|nr:carboxypeptidase-like regulatory domain-containing protein [Tannerellaceae bacterium]
MKKKKSRQVILQKKCKKLSRIMKVVFICLLIGTNIAMAGLSYAQVTSITLNLKDVELEDVFDEVRRQSDFEFFYNNDQVNTSVKVSIDIENAGINEILDKILPDVYEYKINDRYILISRGKMISRMISPAISGQEEGKDIRGRVVDQYGEAVAGAHVLEKGTHNGVITDVDGNFSLSVSEKAVIQVSYIGYEMQDIPVNNQTVFSVIMRESSQ